MTDDLVKQSIAELRDFVRCRPYMVDAVRVVADRIEELEAKLAKAVGQMQRVKDYRYDPNIGIELNRLEEALAELKEQE